METFYVFETLSVPSYCRPQPLTISFVPTEVLAVGNFAAITLAFKVNGPLTSIMAMSKCFPMSL